MNYSIDVASLHENFSPHCEVPQLLLEFADWLKNKPRGSVGYFRLQGDRFNDFWIENGADLHPYFAFFLRDPTGRQIGYWLYDGRAMESPPIVMVGSEGQLLVLSNTLEEFLARLAEGKTQADDLDSQDNGPEVGAELAKWLKSHVVERAIQAGGEAPDLSKWMENWGQQQRDWIDKDSVHVQIADKLRKYVKANAEPWETANFDVLLVGTQFKMWHRSFGPKPMPPSEVTDLEPLFRSVREQRARKYPQRGLWFTAWVKVGMGGGANLCCNFMDEPKILDERPIIPASDYDLDLNTFSRSKHWMPNWLERRA